MASHEALAELNPGGRPIFDVIPAKDDETIGLHSKKGGIRVIDLEVGDKLMVAGTPYVVVRRLANWKLLIRPCKLPAASCKLQSQDEARRPRNGNGVGR